VKFALCPWMGCTSLSSPVLHWIVVFPPCNRRGHCPSHLHPVETRSGPPINLSPLLLFVLLDCHVFFTLSWRVAQLGGNHHYHYHHYFGVTKIRMIVCCSGHGSFLFSFQQCRAIISWPWRHFEGPCCIPMPFDNEIRPVGSEDEYPLDLPLS
jgi:hypothetical protein